MGKVPLIYRVHVMTRKFLGDMTRKLSLIVADALCAIWGARYNCASAIASV
jgi:hypothetical protein